MPEISAPVEDTLLQTSQKRGEVTLTLWEHAVCTKLTIFLSQFHCLVLYIQPHLPQTGCT